MIPNFLVADLTRGEREEEGAGVCHRNRGDSCLEKFVEWINVGIYIFRNWETQGFLGPNLKIRKYQNLGVLRRLHVSHLSVSGLGIWKKTWSSARYNHQHIS